ncbi:hypothetical protein BU26DRAFT_528454 [Trematosphaeria pertusa]|uniref:Abscission/NoCut checkpoint regulator n=1 Tax=Trematosphaeria pertusa TaxID=390896 RepID=A0A6A6IRI9_9PLEO|nr:uncharacterized protein BU26DRAFT_528454 [Trematosphaeria pertusa]KAF2253175.1 hypothetical protein BU26DRAFT_528454 [Trematosphaeria pertusa]
MPDSTPVDDSLLARLNALKKSSVSFDTNFSASVAPSASAPPSNAPDDLAARFARLSSASLSSSPIPSRTASSSNTQTRNDGAPIIAPGAPSYLEGIAEGVGGGETEVNPEDEKSLEELLDELNLGQREEWDLSGKDEKDVGKLLKDIRTILPEVQKSVQEKRTQTEAPADAEGGKKEEELMDWENVEVDIGSGGVRVGNEEQHGEEDGDEGEQKKTEDQEANDVIARVMAELQISKKYDPPSPPPEDSASDSGDQKSPQEKEKATSRSEDKTDSKDDSSLNLPSAPKSLPSDDFAKTQALEDALTARLAALSKPSSDSLGLPSAPSFAPAKKPPKIESSLSKALEEEVDTWCIICTDDSTLKCLGCDGDLYCQTCWMEGHRGESAGFEERRHKAVLYSRDRKKKKQAATQ